MGSGEEWANDGSGRRGCPLSLAGALAAVLLAGYGVFVVVADMAKLFS